MDEEIIIFGIVGVIILLFAIQLSKALSRKHTQLEQKYQDTDLSKTKIGVAFKGTESFVNNQFDKAKRFTDLQISKRYLTGCSWLLIDKNETEIIYSFNLNGELLIITNGLVERVSYELLNGSSSIIITYEDKTEYLRIVNKYDSFLFLKKVANNTDLLFANQTKFEGILKEQIRQIAKRNNLVKE